MWQLRRVAETGSTNVDVAALARDGAPEGTAVVADYQNAGRGRLDRTWQAPPSTSLAVSFLLRPTDVEPTRWPWLPHLIGVAVIEAVAAAAGVHAQLKWPNDVLVAERKLAGILVERVDTDDGAAAVAGVGLNVTQQPDQLPPGATSLTAEASTATSRDEVLQAVQDRLAYWYQAWRAAGGDPRSGLAAAYRSHCSTIGRRVRVELPGQTATEGVAVDVDDAGRLVLDTGHDRVAVGAGDIVHLRAI